MVQRSQLSNGIRVVTEWLPNYHSVALGFWITCGSRHELPSEIGAAHLVEHMLFKGTGRRTAQRIARDVDAVGGSLNAFSSREFSCYHARDLTEHLPFAVDLLSDMVSAPRFDRTDLDKERQVVLQEISRLADSPDDLIHELFSQSLWGNHPLGFPSSGTTEAIAGLDRGRLLQFVERHYVGRRVVVSAAGAVDHDRLMEMLEDSLGRLPAGHAEAHLPAPQAVGGRHLTRRQGSQAHLCLGTQAVGQQDPRRFSLFLLDAILGSSMSSRLFQTVREQHGLAYSVYSYPQCHADSGALAVYCGSAPESMAAAAELILEQLRRLSYEVVTEEELEVAKQQMRGQLLLSLEGVDTRMSRLAKGEIYLGRVPAIDEILHAFAAVSREQLLGLAHELFSDQRMVLHLLGPVAEDDFASLPHFG